MSSLTRVDTGASFGNLSRWRSLDPVLLFSTLALCAFGIFAVYVAGTDQRQEYAADQALGFVFGVMVAIPLALVDYRIWKQKMWMLFGLTILLLLSVLAGGTTINGSTSWIVLGPVQFQPSEFAKIFMILVMAAFFADRNIAENSTLMKSIALISVPWMLVFLQPDLGTALVFAAFFSAMIFIGGARLRQIAALAVTGIVGVVAVLKGGVLEEYQMNRLTAFLDQEGSGDIGYQVMQSKVAVGSGGLTGKGIEATTLANLGFLPEDHTDFIFANLGERLGFAGCMLLLVLFLVLIWRILHIASISRDRFGVLISVGIAAIFLFHVLVNVGMTLGIMPVTGIPLPFISYGRSSLVTSLLCLGLLQSIAMRSRQEMSTQPRI
ncbi:rod shape-determining protein RodA [Rubrobacter indicoceani]|uniref:rod shape-determining protein RodA n=1 Tax=Rubrobacter indicoceani TaxID=2051957 RepID=UPI0013C4FB82|nr:rod shape-determining protein RodA [Rubrobacter indicoceani]